jgi:hypothetical protein
MTGRRLLWFVIVTGSLVPLVASAQGALEATVRETEEKELAESLKKANQQCGTNIAASIDWSTFKFDTECYKRSGDSGCMSVSTWCGYPVASIADLCGSEPKAKAAIQKKVKRVVCKLAPKGKGALKVGATTVFLMDWFETNLDAWVRARFFEGL